MNNSSVLPPLTHFKNAKLDTVLIATHKINSILKALNPNKAHGWDKISVKMIKICGEHKSIPLELIFNYCSIFLLSIHLEER